ncbi:MAG: hypothetical protein GXP33_08775 [Spirochaetes bacterium]|nr:hypothetical protein [Spirochaetota bacterium]
MKNKLKISHFALFLIFGVMSAGFFSGCRQVKLLSRRLFPAQITIFAQDYWWDGEDGINTVKGKLPAEYNGIRVRYNYRIMNRDSEFKDEINKMIISGKKNVIVLDPVLSLKKIKRIKTFPVKDSSPFIIYFKGYSGNPVPNSINIVYNTGRIYHKAGEICGRLLQNYVYGSNKNNPDSVSRGGLSTLIIPGSKIGILYYPADTAVSDELNNFKKGFLEYGSKEDLIELKINNLNNKPGAERSLKRLKEKGASVFVLFTLNLTPYCLEILKKIGGAAIVEDRGSLNIYSDVILFSIDLNPAAGITAALEALFRNNEKKTVEMDGSIHWGKLSKEIQAVH